MRCVCGVCVCVCVRGSLTLPTLGHFAHRLVHLLQLYTMQECPLPHSPVQPVGAGCEVCMWEVCVCRKCVSVCGRYVRYACGGMCECTWEVYVS